MNVRLLHLSDIHLGTPKVDDHQVVVVDRLLTAVASEVRENGPIQLIAMTGDLIWGNDPRCALPFDQQWDVASDFLDKLITAASLPDRANLIVCPGNHDIDRKKIDPLVKMLVEKSDFGVAQFQKMIGSAGQDMRAPFAPMSDFLDRANLTGASDFRSQGYFVAKVSIGGRTIGLASANTALACLDDDRDQHRLFIGQQQRDSLIRDVQGCDLKIFLTHHPLSWLETTEELLLTKRIREEFDIHLHGHEHLVRAEDSTAILWLATGASYDHSSVENYFSVLSLDYPSSTGKLHVWEFTEGSGHQWRPSTGYRFDQHGYLKKLNCGQLFPTQADDAVNATTLPEGSSRALADQLVAEFGFKLLAGDHTEDGYQTSIFWPVRLREATVIHAVQSFVAAALMRTGAEVQLVIDDLGDPDTDDVIGFEGKLRAWMDIVLPNSGQRLKSSRLSALLAAPDAALIGWATVRNWWAVPTENVANVLSVSKIDPTEIETRSAKRLMNAAMTFSGLAITFRQGNGHSVLSLCGDDERPLWALWQQYCDKSARTPTGHLFTPVICDASGRPLHMAKGELLWDSRGKIEEFVEKAKTTNPDALTWCSRYAVDLKAFRRAGLRGDHLSRVRRDRDLVPIRAPHGRRLNQRVPR